MFQNPADYGQAIPFSGAGVTVEINDSGIDATHDDLKFGTHVVQNTHGLTNLAAYDTMLPITYIEGVPNTDISSGHGTHCAGIVGGTGAKSNGLYRGVAPGAQLVGYGSGAVISILDAVGGLDYAATNQFSYGAPIRVVSNSWGSSGTFDPLTRSASRPTSSTSAASSPCSPPATTARAKTRTTRTRRRRG